MAVFGGSAPLISTWLIKLTGDITAPWYFYVATGVASLLALVVLRKEDFVACGHDLRHEGSAAVPGLVNLQP
ncbi:hypothetical protein D3C81_2256070 [compost metagenome]